MSYEGLVLVCISGLFFGQGRARHFTHSFSNGEGDSCKRHHPKKGEWGLPWWFRVRTLSFHSKGVCVQLLIRELRSHVLHSQKRRETGWQETQYRRVVLYPGLMLTVPTLIPHSRASTSVSAAHTICCCLVAKLCPTLVTPWTVARQVPPSVGFPRQEYWSMLPFPPAEDLPDPGI